jgi:hypothetical protein
LDICVYVAFNTMYLAVLPDGVLSITSGTSIYAVEVTHTLEMSYVRFNAYCAVVTRSVASTF